MAQAGAMINIIVTVLEPSQQHLMKSKMQIAQ
jgi:hypothetical protein